jgi:UDP-3-O-[3-hydroxymyristoyl] glucosamine N-acyltransferase
MKSAAYPLGQLAQIVEGQLVGDAGLTITGVANLENAREGEISFVTGPDTDSRSESTAASALIVSPTAKSSTKPRIITEDPRLAFSKVLELFAPERRLPVGIDPSAHVGNNVKLGRRVSVGAGAFIGDNAMIGDDVVIHPLAYLGHEVTVGSGSELLPHSFIGDRVSLGERVTVHAGAAIGCDGFGYLQTAQGHRKIPQIGTVIVDDDVEIGATTTVDRATVAVTRIGRGTKIDDGVHVAHNVVIGENCMLCGQVGIAGSAILGNNVVLAGQAGVSDHVRICDNVIVGGGAAVIGNIDEPGVYSGSPARPHHSACRAIAAQKKVPELMKRLRELERRVADMTGERED